MLKIKVKKLTETARIPRKTHRGDLCFDFFIDEDVCLTSGTTKAIKTGVALELPEGYGLELYPRSSASMSGIIIDGKIDNGYRGEIKIIATFVGKSNEDILTYQKGDRIAQGVLTKIYDVEIEEVDELSDTERADKGFGSSGR